MLLFVSNVVFLKVFLLLLLELILFFIWMFLQNSEQFRILLMDGPLIGLATTRVRQSL